MEKLVFKSYSDLVNDIRDNLSKINNYSFDLVVGIPRSGMVPAYIISAYLNIDCTDVDSFIENRPLQKGITRKTKHDLFRPHDAQRVLLVDDSIFSGDSVKSILLKIPIELTARITKLAIYSSELKPKNVDLFLVYIYGKKLFEWGIFHNNIIKDTCIDIDGVISSDPLEEDNDDGEKYIEFIRNSKPLFLPTGKIHALVSNRLEKYRTETELWLKKHHVEYNELVLLDLPSKEERQKIDAGIDHKGKYYKNSNSILFIESSYNQSLSIAKTAGKPVYCVDKNIYIEPEFLYKFINNPKGVLSSIIYNIKCKLKPVWVRLKKVS